MTEVTPLELLRLKITAHSSLCFEDHVNTLVMDRLQSRSNRVLFFTLSIRNHKKTYSWIENLLLFCSRLKIAYDLFSNLPKDKNFTKIGRPVPEGFSYKYNKKKKKTNTREFYTLAIATCRYLLGKQPLWLLKIQTNVDSLN